MSARPIGVKPRRLMAFLAAIVLTFALMSAFEPDEAAAQIAPPDGVAIGQPGHIGLGIGGGTLTSGVTAKYYVGERHALQAYAGLWRFGFLSPSLSLDYVQELGPIVDIAAGHLVWAVGGGVGTIFDLEGLEDIWHFGISAVTGPIWQFKFIPVEFGLDFRPSLVFGDVYGGVQLGFGGAIRWYFF